MKKRLLVFVVAALSFIEVMGQEAQKKDLVGYGGGRYEVFKTGGQESIDLWFKWMELHVKEDTEGILALAHDDIVIEAPEATLNGKAELKEWMSTTFTNGDLTVEHRWAVPLRFVNDDGSVNPGDWIVNDYVVNYKTNDGLTIDDSEANVYIVEGKVRYMKIFTFKKETRQTKKVTFSVDLNNSDEVFSSVSVFGSFNNWCASCDYLTDLDNDGIYTGTFDVAVGELQYKFTLDKQKVEEQFEAGAECCKTIGDYTNRVATITEDSELAAVCFNSCTSCK
ncbi:MAG: hypothetical protein ACPHPL_01195 [Flavobacteriaceae bacterium]|jgi:hypothetical protein|nr:MAG: Uncharacterised protein [Formosa sp. Hel3_A1_48]|tara:strand:- start:57 stop:896 length:840 start_codon:yes stop_codon:yes gene_type:complete